MISPRMLPGDLVHLPPALQQHPPDARQAFLGLVIVQTILVLRIFRLGSYDIFGGTSVGGSERLIPCRENVGVGIRSRMLESIHFFASIWAVEENSVRLTVVISASSLWMARQ